MSEPAILLQRSEGLARLTLNAPAKANAFTMNVLAELEDTLALIEADRSIRVVLLTGAGDRFFCAGGAFHDWGQMDPQAMGRTYIRTTNRIFDRIEMLDPLCVTFLNGDAIGGGLELALAADVCVAHPRARISVPELSIGAVPGMRGIERLSRLIGLARAKDLVLTGRRIDADTAVEWGLVSRIADDRDGLEDELAASALRQSGAALATAKQMFRALTGGPAGAHAVHEIAGIASKYSDDGREGVAALMQKRKPDFAAGGGNGT